MHSMKNINSGDCELKGSNLSQRDTKLTHHWSLRYVQSYTVRFDIYKYVEYQYTYFQYM